MTIFDLMKYVVKEKCSDLHLSSGEKPIVRKSGDLVWLDQSELSPKEVVEMLKSIATEAQFKTLETT